MKKIFLIAVMSFMALFFVSCNEEQKSEGEFAVSSEDLEKSEEAPYFAVVDNYYKARRECDAAYQMEVFAPAYKEYVLKTYGYADEREMAAQLQSIIEQECEGYKASYGENYTIVHDIQKERALSTEEISSLKQEMEAQFGGDFSVSEAVEVTVKVLLTANEQSASAEDVMVLGKLKDGKWYILK